MPDTSNNNRRNLSPWSRDVLRAALVDMVGKALTWGVVSGLALLGLLIWQGGAVPAWVLALAVALVAAAGILFRRQAERRAGELEESVELLEDALQRHDAYFRHITVVLDNLQRVVGGELAVDLREYIERGILQPARDLLTPTTGEHVRLSVLMPEGADWRMEFGAGHSLTGRQGYRVPIDRTLSRHAYKLGQTQRWNDVHEDRDFVANPAASAPIRSMLSVPVRVGDDVVGVFNVISELPGAFNPAEERYVDSLGGAINIAVGYWRDRGRSAS